MKVNLNQIIYLFFLSFVLACTQSKDGPIGTPDSGEEGVGFYLAGQLDSGRVYHPYSDSLLILLDQFYTVTDCSLDYLDWNTSIVEDSLLVIYGKVFLNDMVHVDCANLGLNQKREFYTPPPAGWEDYRQILLAGNHPDRLYGKNLLNPVPIFQDSLALLDTMLLRYGKNQDSLFNFATDSNIWNDTLEFVKIDSGGAQILRRVALRTPVQHFLSIQLQKCIAPNFKCNSLYADTLWPRSIYSGDSLNAFVRMECSREEGELLGLKYCLESEWVRDSSMQDTSYLWLDTLETYGDYYVERVNPCQRINFFEVQLVGRFPYYPWRIRRELFSMDSILEAEDCAMGNTIVAWDLSRGMEVKEPLLLDTLLAQSLMESPL